MDLSDEDKSIRLYETLVQIGVSEKMRLVRREEILGDIKGSILDRFPPKYFYEKRFFLHFGSCIEGTSISALAPDKDLIILISGGVINDASEGINEQTSLLIVQSKFPGYVKLQMVKFGKPLDITNSYYDPFLVPDTRGRFCIQGVFVLTFVDGEYGFNLLDDYFLTMVLSESNGEDFRIHGPANHLCNVDHVPAYECYDLLNIIPQWVNRKRVYEWPSTHLLVRCSQYPTLLVKTGHPFSEEKAIEWRISFSFFERELMFSLNPTQHKCYVTLKMIKNDILNQEILNQALPKDNQALSKEFITSYHLKTCVFWAVENTPEEMWRPDQLLRCVSVCLWYLLYFVLIKNCPNYFLPTANLFQRPAFLKVQSSRLNVIIHSVIGLVEVICRIKCADVGYFFEGRFSTKTKEPCLFSEMTDVRFSTLNYLQTEIFLIRKVEEEGGPLETKISSLINMLKLVRDTQIPSLFFGSDDLAIQDVKSILSLQIKLRLTHCYALKAIATPDESERLQLIKLTKDYSRDLFTARLMYLTLLFKLNRLSECEKIINDLQARLHLTKTIIFCECNRISRRGNDTDIIERDINTLFKNQVTCMVFMPEEKGIVPEPLGFELNIPLDCSDIQVEPGDYKSDCTPDCRCVDGMLYSVFMKYLVYSGLKNVAKKESCLLTFLRIVPSGELSHEAVAYNIMGWICAREGMLLGALNWWKTSLERHPRPNAVNSYCVDFFAKCAGLDINMFLSKNQ